LFAAFSGSVLRAQERPPLFINEVIADNTAVPPTDVRGVHVDMVEIYNASDEPVVLGASARSQSFALSASTEFCLDANAPACSRAAWLFPVGPAVVLPGARLVVFCDADSVEEGLCELHASFEIPADGTQPITLWGPETENGERSVVDQVWLPPLPENVSFGRFPDGSGPAPVSVDMTRESFFFNAWSSESPPSFGNCIALPVFCNVVEDFRRRHCLGSGNSTPSNLPPQIRIAEYSGLQPSANEPLQLRVEVCDDEEPLPPNVARVEARFRVGGGLESVAVFTLDSAAGLRSGAEAVPPRPVDRWSEWTGAIPGQPAGSRIEFFVRVEDAEAGVGTYPDILCPAGVGSCDREFGGPGCERDPESTIECCHQDSDGDIVCEDNPRISSGEGFAPCSAPLRYTAGYELREPLRALVINEVVPRQLRLLVDCTSPQAGPCADFEDFAELHNAGKVPLELFGMGLSDTPFWPEKWRFPPGSVIGPGEYLIVWLDDDGAKCPDPARPSPPCFWECPDPTVPTEGEYHTNFAIDLDGDNLLLFDTEANGFGLIHGVSWPLAGGLPLSENRSLSLLPDGSRDGCFLVSDRVTPREPNRASPAEFVRGDSNADGALDVSDAVATLGVLFLGAKAPWCMDAGDATDDGYFDISDAVTTLNFLFLGGPALPEPRAGTCGVDPSDDGLGCESYAPCPPCQ
jgi:hypothetical protein